MTINQRLRAIIEAMGLNTRSFSQSAGIDPAVMHNIASEKGRQSKPSFEVLEKIILSYDNINPDYLLTGKGPLFRESQNEMYIKKEPEGGKVIPKKGGKVRGKVIGEKEQNTGETGPDPPKDLGGKGHRPYPMWEDFDNYVKETIQEPYKANFKGELAKLAANQGKIIMIIAEQLESIQDKLDRLLKEDE